MLTESVARSRKQADINHEEMAKTKYRDPKAYAKFKEKPTDYKTHKKCQYGDKTQVCNPDCRFWESCIKGKLRKVN